MSFWVFEGIDGAGKSTLIQLVKSELESRGHTVVLTREPGGTELGEEIRELLLRTHKEAPTPKTELLLYEAIRAQHVEKVITPALKNGKWVLCDRYTGSTLAFQAGGRGMFEEDIQWLNNFATSGVVPSRTILLDLDIQTSQERMKDRKLDRFESENQDFHKRVRDYYLKLSKHDRTWLVLDANHSPDELFQSVVRHLGEEK